MSKIRLGVFTIVALLALGLPTQADEKQDKPEPADDRKDRATEPDKTYTNEDLERLFPEPSSDAEKGADDGAARKAGQPDAAEADKGTESPQAKQDSAGNSLQWLDERKAAQREHQKALAEAGAAVTDAEARVRELEERLRALRNPLLKRPAAPEDDPEWAGRSTPERVAQTEAELEGARAELTRAQSELDRLRAAGPAPSA